MESKNIVSEIPTIHNKIFDFRFQKKQITVSAIIRYHRFAQTIFALFRIPKYWKA